MIKGDVCSCADQTHDFVPEYFCCLLLLGLAAPTHPTKRTTERACLFQPVRSLHRTRARKAPSLFPSSSSSRRLDAVPVTRTPTQHGRSHCIATQPANRFIERARIFFFAPAESSSHGTVNPAIPLWRCSLAL